jgi:phosphate transport system substrate-binding protein
MQEIKCSIFRQTGTAILLVASLAGQTFAEPVKGQSFSDPELTVQMPEKWQQQPINYDKAVKQADLVVSFGQQTYPALKNVVADFASKNKMNIMVQSGTCGISAGRLLRKTIDSGVFCCPPGKGDRLPNLEFHTIAISPIAVIVHKDNPLNNIDIKQARKIFQGKVHHWSKLTDNFNNHIISFGRLHCKKRPGHWTLLLKDQTKFGPKLKEVGVIPDLISKVDMLPNAVAIETPYMVKKYSKLKNVKMLSVNNHPVTDTNYVASGQYPLYRTYSITTWNNIPEKRELVLKMVDYLREHIEINYAKYNFVPISKLHKSGWKFRNDELVSEPDGSKLHQPDM